MVLNYIWIAFFVIAFIFALIGLAMGDTTIYQLQEVYERTLIEMKEQSAKNSTRKKNY